MTSIYDTSRTRPQGYQDNNGIFIPDSFSDEAFRGIYDGNNNLIYKGFARPGTPEDAKGWQIAQLNYDANNNIISILWPLNDLNIPSNDYEFIWDDGSSNYQNYTYV